MADRRVLVTGGAGYIGSHACKALASSGFEPVVFDSLEHGHRSAVRWGPFVRGHLGDGGALKGALSRYDCEAVLHFAAYAYVGESMSQPGRYFRNNVVGSLTLLEAMVEVGVKHLVFSSSCAVYGVPQGTPISESTLCSPANPYGESKLIVERAIEWFSRAHGIDAVSLRYFNAAGADPNGELGECHDPETHLVPRAIGAALGTLAELEVFGTDYATADGSAVRDYVHVCDLADAHVRALEHLRNGGSGGALNLGTGHGYSVLEVIRAVEQIGGRAVPVRHAPRRAGDPPVLVADPSAARECLGWAPQHSDLPNIVASAWRWHASRAAHVASVSA